MIISSSLWPSGNTDEAPPIQLSSEAGIFGLLKKLWQNVRRKLLLFVNEKPLPVWQPRNDISGFITS
jgi:hypothetical protein